MKKTIKIDGKFEESLTYALIEAITYRVRYDGFISGLANNWFEILEGINPDFAERMKDEINKDLREIN